MAAQSPNHTGLLDYRPPNYTDIQVQPRDIEVINWIPREEGGVFKLANKWSNGSHLTLSLKK